jgi:hypothetical protein
MTSALLADDVRRYIMLAISSVPYLEALLLLHSSPQQVWNAAGIARRLYCGEAESANLLAALVAAGIAEHGDGGYWYCPRDKQMAMLFDDLAAAYSSHLIEITQLIHSKADGRAETFANAFLIKHKR